MSRYVCGIASTTTPDLHDEHSSGRPINAAVESLNKRSVSEAALFFRNVGTYKTNAANSCWKVLQFTGW